MIRKRAGTLIAVAGACLMAGGDARSAPPGGKSRPPTAAEFAALKQRVDQQNELIMKLTQLEGEHYEFLLKVLQNIRPGAVPPGGLPRASAPPAPQSSAPAAPVASAPEPPMPAQVETTDSVGGQGGRPKLGSITGRVELKGKTHGPVYVYVENIKEPAVERHIEIMQKDRAFVPDAVIVQRGTRITFPNADPVLHNVFSPSPTQPFDLGSYRQGEKAGVVRLFTPGVVEVFCNMHSKMHAAVLVVPNRHYVKANPDGTYRLDNVPIGARQVSAWAPDAHITTETVNLTAAGAAVNLSVQAEPHAHPMKDGRPYDPYKE